MVKKTTNENLLEITNWVQSLIRSYIRRVSVRGQTFDGPRFHQLNLLPGLLFRK